MQAYILSIMQVSIYISENDYETLSTNKPAEFRTNAMFLADVLRKKAEFFRKAIGADGTPMVPQYPRQ